MKNKAAPRRRTPHIYICLLLPALLAANQDTRLDVPTIKQPYNLCMVASVSMVLGYWDMEVPPAEIAKRVPVYKDGTTGRDMLEYVESIGFRGFLIQPELDDLFRHLKKGRPLIVALPGSGPQRHAMVVVGFDQTSLWLNDPASGKVRQMRMETFKNQWHETHNWTFLIIPK